MLRVGGRPALYADDLDVDEALSLLVDVLLRPDPASGSSDALDSLGQRSFRAGLEQERRQAARKAAAGANRSARQRASGPASRPASQLASRPAT